MKQVISSFSRIVIFKLLLQVKVCRLPTSDWLNVEQGLFVFFF
jgi:hypothetical protein